MDKFQINQIFQQSCHQIRAETLAGIDKRQVGDIVFLLGGKDFLTFYIIAGNTIDDKRRLKCLQIIVNGLVVALALLAFYVVRNRFGTERITDIVK